MGSCLSNNADPEATRVHREVERELKAVCAVLWPSQLIVSKRFLSQHAKKQNTQVKVLLLGSGDSGKSTILKVRLLGRSFPVRSC